MPVVSDYTALIGNSGWNAAGPGPIFLTYSMSSSVPVEYVTDTGMGPFIYPETVVTFRPFDAGQQAMIRQAFQIWGAACGITFLEVSSNNGDIQLGQYSFASDPLNFPPGIAGEGIYPSRGLGSFTSSDVETSGDVLFNTGALSLGLAIHEIGHALGLKHPFDGFTTLALALDNTSNTVMSYTGGLQNQLGSLDIAAVQQLYGLNSADGTEAPGGWSWNAALEQLTIIGSPASQTLQGASSNDIITGLGGNDRLVGWAGNDRLDGGDGDDMLLGGGGDDTFIGGLGNDEFRSGDYTSTVSNGTTQTTFSYIGFDTADYSQSTVAIDVDMSITRFDNTSGKYYHATGLTSPNIGFDFFDGIERVFGGTGSDQLRGSVKADVLIGGVGSDQLSGLAGNDTLLGDGAVLMTDHAAAISRLYLATLARLPDAAGHAGWTAQYDAGTALNTIATGFVNSAEFQAKYGALDSAQFVTLLYNNVLHRAPDSGGLANWVGYLNGGASRESVVTGFSDSAEFVSVTDPVPHSGQVYRLYGATLDRQPDAGGFAGWVDYLDNGQRLANAAGGFTGSAEFQAKYGALNDTAFVTLLYSNVLHRGPDSGGLAGWLGALNGGASRTDVVLGFSESAEYVAGTNSALRTYMQTVQPTWNDTINGGTGNDSVSGGHGADTFVFAKAELGVDHVYQVESWDTLQFSGFGYANAAAAQSHLVQSGADVVFADQGETITFHGTTLADLQAATWVVT
jgi:Ca2+-binding RTX toxin-like protein